MNLAGVGGPQSVARPSGANEYGGGGVLMR